MEQRTDPDEPESEKDLVIPVVAEQLHVDTVSVPAGGVRIIKRVVEDQVEINENLRQQHAEIEHVPIGRFVDGPQPIRQTQSGVTVIPVVEEQIVVERRWLLKEEIHVRQTVSSKEHREKIPVRREKVDIERF